MQFPQFKASWENQAAANNNIRNERFYLITAYNSSITTQANREECSKLMVSALMYGSKKRKRIYLSSSIVPAALARLKHPKLIQARNMFF